MGAAQTPTTATLTPCPEESVDWDTTQNVFIEGDNLEVLKILQKHYYGKIKMIYIDPPYNTGKDFVYSDNYADPIGSYLELTGQKDEQGRLTTTNRETEGRFHSNWLNMMYPRLKLARNLLTEDGFLLISIDDHEVSNLQILVKEIFGESCSYTLIIWKKKNTPPNDKVLGAQHDYILCVARTPYAVLNLKKRSAEQISKYQNPDNHVKGPWVSGDLSANIKGGRYVESLSYPIRNPNTGEDYWPPSSGNWRFSQAKMLQLLDNDEIYFGRDGTSAPKLKRFLSDVRQGVSWSSIWDFAPFNTVGSKEMGDIFGSTVLFESPKPVGLLTNILQLASSPDGLILDFFAGSATTAHAAMQLNAEDGGDRKFIMVQLPEPTPEKSEAHKAGYKTISEISRERIRRAGVKIREDFAEKISDRETPLDTGFRAFRLTDTNFSQWHIKSDTPPEDLGDLLDELANSTRDEAAPEQLLTELLLKIGFGLSESIAVEEISGLEVFSVAEGLVLAYVNEHMKPTLEQFRGLVAQYPAKLVVLEDCIKDDEIKTNLMQECRNHGVELWTA